MKSCTGDNVDIESVESYGVDYGKGYTTASAYSAFNLFEKDQSEVLGQEFVSRLALALSQAKASRHTQTKLGQNLCFLRVQLSNEDGPNRVVVGQKSNGSIILIDLTRMRQYLIENQDDVQQLAEALFK